MQPNKHDNLLKKANDRVAFKRSLFGFIVMNLLFWIVWLMNAGADYLKDMRGVPWPVWITSGWGIAIVFQYFRSYRRTKNDLAEAEYKRLQDNKAE